MWLRSAPSRQLDCHYIRQDPISLTSFVGYDEAVQYWVRFLFAFSCPGWWLAQNLQGLFRGFEKIHR